MIDAAEVYWAKAEESLAGAANEFAQGQYNNCASRCYYACFQAAIVALLRAGVLPRGGEWGHAFVRAEFVDRLINRCKLYSTELRDALERTCSIRETADYRVHYVAAEEAARVLRRARSFVSQVSHVQRGPGAP